MAINIQLLTSRLKEFKDDEKRSEASKFLWSPKEGPQTVRIVPYKFNPDSPFIELKFYYKLAGKTYLAPCTFGKPDPILEFVEVLRSGGSQAQRELAKKMEAKSRTYAPIILRGKEEEGVKFWGFGVTVYKSLLTLITDPEWGDITSLTDGNDIKVEFHKDSKKKGKDGKSFPETTITPSPRKSPVVDPTRSDLIQKVKEQPDLLTIWTLPEYNDLKFAMDKFLNPELASETDTEEVGEDVDETAVSIETPPPVSVTQQAPHGTPPADLGQAFEEFFKK
jgi:hypothetical protein